MHLIGIAGPAGSGKSTAATHICRQWGFCQMAFADPLKDMLAAMFDIPRGQLESQLLTRDAKESEIPGLGVSPRRLMQTLGTEWGRQAVCNDLWVNLARRRVAWLEDHLPNEYPGVVFSDVRFENEASMIREAGGTIIHLTRETRWLPQVSQHCSEDGVQIQYGRDIVLGNGGTIEDFERSLELIGSKHGYREAA